MHARIRTAAARLAATLAVATFAAGSPAVAEDAAQQPTREELLAHPEVEGALAAIDAWVEGTRVFDRVPGISVGVVRDQDLLWSSGYGFSNRESKWPADADTIYSICSISKLFTAVAVMQLRDRGALELRDPVSDHLDWFRIGQAHDDSGPITIESLLTHSSGLPRESDFPYWNGPDFPFPTREQVIERLAAQQTLYPSQRLFQYSNLGLTLAGEIVQAVSGQPYADYVRENVLDPLGLADTRTQYPRELRGRQLAIGYSGIERSQRREPVPPFDTRAITPAAGFTSSVRDLAAFASWQFRLLDGGGDEVLAANTLREMQRVHWVDPDWETTWGLGFSIRREDDVTLVGHGGGCPGYITSFVMVPRRRLGAVVLTNAGDGPAERLAGGILEVIGPAIAAAGTPRGEPVPDLSLYEGNYRDWPWGGEVAIRQWGERLVAIDLPRRNLENLVRLEHDGDHTFTRLTKDGERREPWTFELDEAGRVVRIRRHSSLMMRID